MRTFLCQCTLVCVVSAAIGGARAEAQQPEPPRHAPLATRCDVADMRGNYGFFRSGTVTQGPLAAVGLGQFDGSGNATINQMTSRNGTFSQGSFPLRYDINADCTGTWMTPDGTGLIGYFVLLDGGNEFFFLSTMAGNTVVGHAKRIAPGGR